MGTNKPPDDDGLDDQDDAEEMQKFDPEFYAIDESLATDPTQRCGNCIYYVEGDETEILGECVYNLPFWAGRTPGRLEVTKTMGATCPAWEHDWLIVEMTVNAMKVNRDRE
jgi:hypothetical protein